MFLGKMTFTSEIIIITLSTIIFSFLQKGIVEKLEVVNKKWVRVKLLPGNSVQGAVSINFL